LPLRTFGIRTAVSVPVATRPALHGVLPDAGREQPRRIVRHGRHGSRMFVLAFRADALPRERLMSIALIGSAVLTLLTAFAWNYPALPAMTLLEGFLLSGVSAVAPAYFGEELGPAIIGVSISLYLSGNHIGGMPGRVTGTLIEGWSDWRTAACAVGTAALIISTVFARKPPRSRNFRPRRIHMSVKLKRMGGLLTRFSFLGRRHASWARSSASTTTYRSFRRHRRSACPTMRSP